MAEKLNVDKKRQLIDDFLYKVMDENPSYYYTPAADIARAIHSKIKLQINRLAIEDQLLLKKLSVRDIQIILSIKSRK